MKIKIFLSNLFRKLVTVILIVGITFVFIELVGQIAFKIKIGQWYFNRGSGMFISHPYLVGTPRPSSKVTSVSSTRKDAIVTISHNLIGYRGHEVNINKKKGIKRICAIGGSTTYCIGVSDDETWPYFMENDMLPRYEVINLGVPGYNSVEHIIQTALHLSELSPDYAIYYLGWNDLRNMHIANLKSDYSDFHGKSQYYNLGLIYSNYSIVIDKIKYFLITGLRNSENESMFPRKTSFIEATETAYTPEIDQRPINLYKRNLKSIIALCKSQNIIPIMVPQLVSHKIAESCGNRVGEWAPFVRYKDTEVIIEAYNKVMKEVAFEENIGFIEDITKRKFEPDDFLDVVHFSPQGNRKFAKILSNYLLSKNN